MVNTFIQAFWTPGPMELAVIALIALLMFGRKLPEIARNLGKSLTEFKKGINETKDDIQKDVDSYKKDINDQSDKAAGNDDNR